MTSITANVHRNATGKFSSRIEKLSSRLSVEEGWRWRGAVRKYGRDDAGAKPAITNFHAVMQKNLYRGFM